MKLTPLVSFAVLSASLLAVQASTPSPADSTLEARRGGGGGAGLGRSFGSVPDSAFSLPWLRNSLNFFSAQNWCYFWSNCVRNKPKQPEFDSGWFHYRKREEMTSEVEATLVTKQPITLIREDALLPRRTGSGVQIIDLNLSRNFLNAFRYESPSYCPWWWCPNELDDDIEDLRVLQKLSKRGESGGLKKDDEAQLLDYQSNDSQAATGSLSASPVYDEGGEAEDAQADSDEFDTYENIAKRLEYDSSRDEDESIRGVQAAKIDEDSDGLETKDAGSSSSGAQDDDQFAPAAEYAVGLAG